MTIPISAHEVMDREFLEIRAKLLRLAAHFDRIERARGEIADDPRLQKIRLALETLSSANVGPHRAEQLQLIFSREYDPKWQENLGVPAAPTTNR